MSWFRKCVLICRCMGRKMYIGEMCVYEMSVERVNVSEMSVCDMSVAKVNVGEMPVSVKYLWMRCL